MEENPNLFAYVALLAWPLVALMLYRSRPMVEATIWTILGAFLLLPVDVFIKLPIVPALDKNTIPNICAFIGCISISRREARIRRSFGLIELLIALYILSPIVTSWLNPDPIVYGKRVLPGVGLYDGTSAAVSGFVYFLSFLIGRRFLRTAADHEKILRALAMAGVVYSLPLLFEIRFSPQLHNWVYGFHPSEFVQSIRDGGYRPMVFTGHGLMAAFFVVTTVVASTALWRIKVRTFNLPATGVTMYLAGILVLCKSAGALVYGAMLAPLVRLASARLQLRIAVLLVAVALAFPLLRTAGLFPTTSLVEMAATFSKERADSLKFRFDHEEALLTRAGERFWFGWGRYGRNRVYNEYGTDESITDGLWILTLGEFGFIGFMAQFLLLTIPVFYAAFAVRYERTLPESLSLAALALIVAMGVVDQLPNASMRPWTLLLTGALCGRAEFLLASRGRLRSDRSERTAKIGSYSAVNRSI